jgi:hypothetical protein
MRLLLNLITALDDDEAAKVAAMKLRGRQRAVMDLVFSKRSSGEQPSPEETARLELTDSHLYEISSVILEKCHHLLVPEGGVQLLEYLTYKNVFQQFKQELRKQRKNLPNKKGKEAEHFYLSSFELMHRFSYNLVDHDLIAEYGKLYLASKKDPIPEDELAVEARMLQITQTQIISEGKNFQSEQERVFKEFTRLEQTAKQSKHPYLCHSVYSGLAWYWRHLGGKPDRSLHYLQRATPYSLKLEGYIFRDAALEMQLRLADAHFTLGGSLEALEIFEKTYSLLPPDHMLWRRNYYLFRYLEVLIYNNRFTRAEKILQTHFEPQFKIRRTTASATAATLLAILYLFTEDYPKAKKYLDIGFELNTRTNFTLYNEVRNRFIQAAYFYLTGDWDYTLELTNRALQYVRTKDIGLNKHIFGYNFKIIEASVAFYAEGTPFWHKFEEKYSILTSPAEGLFGKLLQKIRSTPRNLRA